MRSHCLTPALLFLACLAAAAVGYAVASAPRELVITVTSDSTPAGLDPICKEVGR